MIGVMRTGISMRRIGLRLALTALLHLPLAAVSCSQQGKTSAGLTRVHSRQGWSNPESPNFHGNYLKTTDYNLSSCASCHGVGFKGDKDVVSCFSCHDFPHAKDFIKLHKDEISRRVTTEDNLSNADNAAKSTFNGFYECLKCHEDVKEVKNGKPGCRYCHVEGTFGFTDHSSIEGLLQSHGEQAKTRGTKPCQTCHALGDTKISRTVFFDAEGKERKPNFCVECHTGVSEPMHWGIKNWKPTSTTESGSHPDHLFEHQCTPCHGKFPELAGKDQSGLQVIKGCSSCHAGFYGRFEHLDPLKTHKNHLTESAAALGIPRLDVALKRCVRCHSLTEDRVVTDQYTDQQKTIPSCTKCHGKNHLEEDFANGTDGGKHKLEVKDNGFYACKKCHGDSFDGSGIVPGCAACHAEGKNYGKVPHKGDGWEFDSGHGLYVKSNGSVRCEFCHSIGDQDTKSTFWPDGTVIPTCFKCHAGPTGKPESHGPDWGGYSPTDTTRHSGFLLQNFYDPGTWVMKLGSDGGNCASCHFDNEKAWETCSTCHAPYPSQHVLYNPDWMTPGNPNAHGILHAGDYKTSCATLCHGEDLQGGSSQVSCGLCHSGL